MYNSHNAIGAIAMAKFKVIISEPETGTSKAIELEESRATPLIGRKVGETMDGSIVDLSGRTVQITGGSDKDGFPMRPSVHGGVRRRVVLSGGVGFNPQSDGARRRKTGRGKGITDEIVQINIKILEKTKRAKGKGKTTEEPKPPEQTSKEAPEKEPT